MEILKGFFANLQSKSLTLNHSAIKSIQVCLDPASLPNIKPVYKLNDNDHNCSITFSKETMKAISDKSSEISRLLNHNEEKTFLINDEIKVFSERMHNQCAVSFLSIQGVRINMMDSTFSKLMRSSGKLALMHGRLEQKVNSNAKNLKQLLDIILAKYNQCANSPDFKVFLQQLHQSASSLCGQGAVQNAGGQIINISDTSNDNEDEDDEDEDEDEDDDEYGYGRRRRRGYGYGYDYDDEEEEDDEDEDVDDY